MTTLLPPHIFLLCMLLSAGLSVVFPDLALLAYPLNMAGLLLVVPGLGLSIAGSRLFARVGTNINPLNAPDKLVTHGPFAYTRNPMYLGFVLALLGVAMLLGNIASILGALIFFTIIQWRFIPMEEAACAQMFGQDYIDYQQVVRRWI